MLVTASHQLDQDVFVSFDKEALKQIASVAAHPLFSNEANWVMVSIVFKHNASIKRLVSGFKNDFTKTDNVKVQPDMVGGEVYELHEILISGTDREPILSIDRSEIANAASMDLTLADAGLIGAVLSTSESTFEVGVPFNISAVFSSAVTGISSEDLTVVNGSVYNFSGSGTTYSFEVVPAAVGNISVLLNENSSIEGNSASNILNFTATLPSSTTVSLTSNATSSVLESSVEITATFSQSISGFDQQDVLVANGEISNFEVSGSGYRYIRMAGKDGWSTTGNLGVTSYIGLSDVTFRWGNVNRTMSSIGATITYLNSPTGSGNLINGTVEAVNNTDLKYWSVSSSFTNMFVIDLKASYNIDGILLGPQGGYNLPRTFKIYGSEDNVNWTEILSVAETTNNWVVGSYKTFPITPIPTNVATFTVTPTLAGGVTTIQIPSNCITGGNTPSQTLAFNYRPVVTAQLQTSVLSPSLSAPFSVVATFSDSVSGFSLSDISVDNGVASNLSGSGSSYTFDVTATLQNAPVTINLIAGSVSSSYNSSNNSASLSVYPAGFYRYYKFAAKNAWANSSSNTVASTLNLSDVKMKWDGSTQNMSGYSLTYIMNPTGGSGNLIDGVVDTVNSMSLFVYWYLNTSTFTDLFKIDVLSPRDVTELLLAPQFGGNFPKTFKVYGSNDNSTWTEILNTEETTNTWSQYLGTYKPYSM